MRYIKIFMCCFLFVFTISVVGQKKKIKIEAIKLTDHIYKLKGQGGNIGIFIGEDGVFMIDDQFASLTPKILSAIKELTDKSVKYLINTHWHGDHTGGNENMYKEGAIIVAHKNVRKRMSVEQVVRGKTKKASPKEALPVISFSEDMIFHINNDDVLVSHIHNAHTDGDVLVYFINNNVLHVGDSYFQGRFPYIDLDSGGSIDGYIEGIKKMIMLINKDTKVIPGHGDISNKAELKTYLAMLKAIRSNIQKEIDKGKRLEEVKVNQKLTEDYKSFNGWITEEKIRVSIYKSLKNSNK
ncbi:MBL fold metallo-hydrolase [uncultured Polaribacter sp.]|uniref:MBL fold metallo-hydrolase n=1 Tax=uncultured Polaribacter sp. TaxID=174711 RepID=UPI002612F372|nr:MBL fold metallo-hydrolase [uncultured Polaribacter sp.]